MQELIKRAKELLADGTVARVLGWKAGDLAFNPEPAYFETPESLEDFVYDGFCGANLSKYMVNTCSLCATDVELYTWIIACGAPLTASNVFLIICSLACVRTWIVTSSGIIFCSINVLKN